MLYALASMPGTVADLARHSTTRTLHADVRAAVDGWPPDLVLEAARATVEASVRDRWTSTPPQPAAKRGRWSTR